MTHRKRFSAEARKGIAILMAALLAVLAAAYLLATAQGEAQERLRQAQAEHDLVSARAGKAAREGASRLVAADGVDAMFLEGETPGLAIAAFQKRAGDAAVKAGLAVQRMTSLDAGDEGQGAAYRLNVDAEGSLEQLRNFLVEIESGLPVMFVTRLEVQPAASEEAQDPFPSEALRMTVGIDAYGRSGQP